MCIRDSPSSQPRYHHQQQHHHHHQPQSEEQGVTTSALRKVRDTIEGRASLSPPSGSLVVTKLQVSLERPTVNARREDLHYYDEQRDQRDRRSHSVDDRYRRRGSEERGRDGRSLSAPRAVSYTHLRAHETSLHRVCRLLLEKKHGMVLREITVVVANCFGNPGNI